MKKETSNPGTGVVHKKSLKQQLYYYRSFYVMFLPVFIFAVVFHYLLSFSASEDGENFCPVGPAFHLEKGTWTGAKLCLWACNRRNEPSGGWGEYDYIHISHKTER